MIIRHLVVGQVQTNCYIVACDETREAVVIDPGDEAGRIFGEIDAYGLEPKYVLNTHAHFDHIGANGPIKNRFDVPLALHPLDIPIFKAGGGAPLFGMPKPDSPDPDMQLSKNQMIRVGDLTFKVLFTPGHSPGHVSFYEESEQVLFGGDVLFDGGIGRTDIPGGDTGEIMRSIREVLFALPAETVVYSGHGNPTTIGKEASSNPWVGVV